jgi:hypothetical protein
VVFGKEASYYAEEHGTKKTVEALESGELPEGMWRTYQLDTLEDADQLIQALDDAWGWDASYFDIDFRDGKCHIKFDE